MHVDRRTDMTRLKGDFRDRAKTPKITRFFCKSYGFLDDRNTSIATHCTGGQF